MVVNKDPLKLLSEAELDMAPWDKRIFVKMYKEVGYATVSDAESSSKEIKMRLFRYLEKVGCSGAGVPNLMITKTDDNEVLLTCTIDAVLE